MPYKKTYFHYLRRYRSAGHPVYVVQRVTLVRFVFMCVIRTTAVSFDDFQIIQSNREILYTDIHPAHVLRFDEIAMHNVYRIK